MAPRQIPASDRRGEAEPAEVLRRPRQPARGCPEAQAGGRATQVGGRLEGWSIGLLLGYGSLDKGLRDVEC